MDEPISHLLILKLPGKGWRAAFYRSEQSARADGEHAARVEDAETALVVPLSALPPFGDRYEWEQLDIPASSLPPYADQKGRN